MIKKILLVLVNLSIILVIIISGCAKIFERNIMGIVENPELPSTPKPNDLLFCEKDEDCTITIYIEDSCCKNGCGGAVNVKGELYLKDWYNLNCKNPITYKDCLVIECCPISGIKCENNKCKGIFNC